MTRSRKKTPIGGVTGNNSCKKFKQQEHGRYRAYEREMIAHEKYDDIQDFKGRFCNEWASPRDGKTHWFSYKYWECNEYRPYFSRWGMLMGSCEGYFGHWHCKVYYNELMRK